MIITTSSSGGDKPIKHGPSLSASVLGFLGLAALYPKGVEAFLGQSLSATRTARLTRIVSITGIFALTQNLLEEYRTRKSQLTDEDFSNSLITHNKSLRQDDYLNPMIAGLIAGSVLQARKRSFKQIVKSGGYFGLGMGAYALFLDYLEPYYPLKSLDVPTLVNDFLHSVTTGQPRN